MGTDILNYSSIMQRETVATFYEKFWKRLITALIKYFGKDEARKIQGAIQRNTVKIESPETYLFATGNLNDSSFELYNTCNSFEDFYTKSLINFKKRAEGGQTSIVVRELFFVLIDMLSRENCIVPNYDLANFLKFLIITLTNTTHPSPFVLQVPDPYYALEIQDILGFNLSKCNEFYETFLMCYNELAQRNHTLPKENFLPNVQIITPAYKESRENQIRYLASLFSEKPQYIRSLLLDIPSLSESSSEFRVILEKLLSDKNITNVEVEDIEKDLKEFKDSSARTHLYSMYHKLLERQQFSKFHKKLLNDTRIQRIIPEYETYIKTFQPYFANVFINCSNIEEEELIFLMDVAKNLDLMKSYMFPFIRKKKIAYPNFKITFTGVDFMHTRFVEIIKQKLRQIKSSTNKNFFVEILGDTTDSKHQYVKVDVQNFRIISDIHHDYNEDRRYKFNFGEDFVINCGDTAGNALHSIKWNKNHLKRGVIITGNHLGYTPLYRDANRDTSIESTRTFQMEMLEKEFSGKKRIKFLENSVTEHQGVIILGTCLYSDFALYGKSNVESSMSAAKAYLNDFRYVRVINTGIPIRKKGRWKLLVKDDMSSIRLITPQDYALYFQKAMDFLKEKVLEFKYKPIIIVTHFAPSPYSIDSEYIGNPANPAFANNLNEFILTNPNIRIWAHGHTHKPFDYILGQTRVICEPFGYNNENKVDLPLNYGKQIPIKDVRSELPWTTICEKEIKKGIIKVYES